MLIFFSFDSFFRATTVSRFKLSLRRLVSSVFSNDSGFRVLCDLCIICGSKSYVVCYFF